MFRLALPFVCLLVSCGGVVAPLEEERAGGSDATPDEEAPTDQEGPTASDGSSQDGDSPDETVRDGELFGPNDTPLGLTYPQLLESYWQWHLSLPFRDHPREGGDCSSGQEGDFWFLTTGQNELVQARSCTVPRDKTLVVLFNSGLLYPRPDCSRCTTADEGPQAFASSWRDDLQPIIGRIKENTAYLEIDGEAKNVDQEYFWISEEPFVADVPPGDPYFPCSGPILQDACGWEAGQARPFASVGYLVVVRRLSAGSHTLRLGATSPSGDWLTDVTYVLDVE